MRPQDNGTGDSLEGTEEAVVGLEQPDTPDDIHDDAPPPEETDFREQNPDFATGDEPMELPPEESDPPVEEDREIPGEDDKPDELQFGPSERDLYEMRLEAERRRADAAKAAHDKAWGRFGALNDEVKRLKEQLASQTRQPAAEESREYGEPYAPATNRQPPPDPAIQEVLDRQRQSDMAQAQQSVVQEYHATIRDFDQNLQQQFGVGGPDTSPEAVEAYKRAVEHVNKHVMERQQDLQRAASAMDPVVMRAEAHSLLTEGLLEALGTNVRKSQEQARQLRERARRRRDLSAPPTQGAVRQRRARPTFPTEQADIEKLSPEQIEAYFKAIGRKGF